MAIRYPQKQAAKYSNKKVVYDGITFDSQKEAYRYYELKLLQRAKFKTLNCKKNLS